MTDSNTICLTYISYQLLTYTPQSLMPQMLLEKVAKWLLMISVFGERSETEWLVVVAT